MATDTLGANETGKTGDGIEGDGLMSTVHAGNIAAAAAHALVSVYLRIDDGVAIQVGGPDKIRQGLTHDFFHAIDSTSCKIVL